VEPKSPSHFNSHDEWLAYVREEIPVAEQSLALARGRTELFKRFYEVRQRRLPQQFAEELARIETLPVSEKTGHLEELNKRIFSDMSSLLFNETQQKSAKQDTFVARSSREQIEDLQAYLVENNRFFGLWVAYKTLQSADDPSEDWEDYLRAQLNSEDEEDIVFARAMAELNQLLLYFQKRNLALPKFLFERCWFLHHLRGPQRMLQTRAILTMLTTEIDVCASV